MTISYDPASGRWKSRYSYDSSCFNYSDNVMLSFNTSVEGEDICYYHGSSSAKNTFYGTQTPSSVSLSFNANPSSNKVYKAISLEGSNLGGSVTQMTTNLSPQEDQRNTLVDNERFIEKGGIFYSGLSKFRGSDMENNVKLVGEITRAEAFINFAYFEPSINTDEETGIGDPFFNGYSNWINSMDDESGAGYISALLSSYRQVYFYLNPSPHYRSIDAASSEDMISKYYVGVETADGISVRPFRFRYNMDDGFNDVGEVATSQFLSENVPSGQLQYRDRLHFDELSSLVWNTQLQPKLNNNVLGVRLDPFSSEYTNLTTGWPGQEYLDTYQSEDWSDFIVPGSSQGVPAFTGEEVQSVNFLGLAFCKSINDYLAQGNRLFLYKITDGRIDGSDPMGQYADVTLNLGVEDFELFAVNAEYTTTTLDHSK